MIRSQTPLIFDPPYHFEQIVIVGVGGTGSQLARCAARMMYHLKQKRQHVPELLLVDPDIVEAHNVGRQMFPAASVGQFKAEFLGKCFNMALGLNIAWCNEALDSRKHIRRGAIVCGCVDNYQARIELARAENCVWLDAGNGYDFGQVVVGNCGNREQVLHSLQNADQGRCHCVPHAGLLFPTLLEPDPEEAASPAALSCGERVERGDQHLYVNDFMGNLAAQYLYKLIHREAITTFMTYLNLSDLSVKSIPLVFEEVNAYLT